MERFAKKVDLYKKVLKENLKKKKIKKVKNIPALERHRFLDNVDKEFQKKYRERHRKEKSAAISDIIEKVITKTKKYKPLHTDDQFKKWLTDSKAQVIYKDGEDTVSIKTTIFQKKEDLDFFDKTLNQFLKENKARFFIEDISFNSNTNTFKIKFKNYLKANLFWVLVSP